MRRQPLAMVGLVGLLAATGGCVQHRPSDMTMQRGAQLLAAGSPKSAIPFLTQTVASMPDGPEPIALLSLAYALDLQPERAIAQAQQVRARRDAVPGWESVAIGIAEMTRHRPVAARVSLSQALAARGPHEPVGQASLQWLALAQVLEGDDAAAIESLKSLAEAPSMAITASLWTTLIHARQGRTAQAAEALSRAAAAIPRPRQSMGENLRGQALYDGGVTALADGDLPKAQRQFASMARGEREAADTAVWLALIKAAQGEWPAARAMLEQAGQRGPLPARGLANQLFSVVYALEQRPDAMIEHMLTGQRLLGRNKTPPYIVEQPKPESVWFSDSMK